MNHQITTEWLESVGCRLIKGMNCLGDKITGAVDKAGVGIAVEQLGIWQWSYKVRNDGYRPRFRVKATSRGG